MRFWDSSAIVPLLVEQPSTVGLTIEFERDPDIVVWWATVVECASALSRLEREEILDTTALAVARNRLDRLAAAWREIQPVDRVRDVASRLLRVHPLRAGDAVQLAAAILAAEDDPRSLALVTLDDRLSSAADREGFPVIRPTGD
jgi:predicted nucleic acid-binding protein